MDDVIVRLNEKLESAVKRLREGNYDDHDILPSLLWVLLEYNRSHRDNLEQLRDRAERTSVEISSLAKTFQDESEKLRHDTSEDLIKTGDDLKTRISDLAQTLQVECEKFGYQLENVADRTGTLLKSSVDGLSEAHQSGLRRTDNKLKWMLIGSIVHIILIAILMFLLFARQINLWLTHWMS